MRRCNFVLSGGGARGFAHIGVVKALQEKGITFTSISGTSSGAIIAAFLCDGYTPDEVAEICREAIPITRFNFHFTQGFLSIESLKKLFAKYLRSQTFEELKYPLFLSVTDLDNGNQVIINKGNLIDALIASASIPIIFSPVTINGRHYADGGLSGNLPTEPFKNSPLKTVGVHVNPLEHFNPEDNVVKQFERTLHLSIRGNVLREMQQTDLLIEPDGLKEFGIFDTKKINEIIEIGYRYVKEKVDSEKFISECQ